LTSITASHSQCDAGVVDQHVYLAEPGNGVPHRQIDAFLRAEIERDRHRLPPCRRHGGRRILETLDRQVGNRDVEAVAGEPHGYGGAEALCGARHKSCAKFHLSLACQFATTA
jgi:hypothetical protein